MLPIGANLVLSELQEDSQTANSCRKCSTTTQASPIVQLCPWQMTKSRPFRIWLGKRPLHTRDAEFGEEGPFKSSPPNNLVERPSFMQ